MPPLSVLILTTSSWGWKTELFCFVLYWSVWTFRTTKRSCLFWSLHVPLLLFPAQIQPNPVKTDSTLTLPGWSSPSHSHTHTQASLESGNKMSSNTNHPSSGHVISKSGKILSHGPVYSPLSLWHHLNVEGNSNTCSLLIRWVDISKSGKILSQGPVYPPLSLWHHLSAEGTSNTCSLLIHWVDMLASGIFYDTQGGISESWVSGNLFHSSLFRGTDTRDLFNYNGCQMKKESWKHQGRPSSSHMVWDSKRNSLPGILNESIGFLPEGK